MTAGVRAVTFGATALMSWRRPVATWGIEGAGASLTVAVSPWRCADKGLRRERFIGTIGGLVSAGQDQKKYST